MDELYSLIGEVVAHGALVKIVYSRGRSKDPIKAEGRTVLLKGLRFLQITRCYTDGKAIHENYPEEKSAEVLCALCDGFRQINLITENGSAEALISKEGKCHLKKQFKGEFAMTAPQPNNKEKHYLIDPKKAAPFLSRLGVCSPEGGIFDKKRSKFRQINRFTEILDDAYPFLPQEGPLTVCDLCCGKSYLTFAVYYYLTAIKGRTVRMYGVDLKSDVIGFCKNTARELSFDGMEFSCMNIFDFEPESKPDLVVSLHACDIATDMVLYNAVRLGAKVILSTPCCHHEMMNQISCPDLAFVTQHSMFAQKMCDALTDALRCKRLEAEGYKVTALELIDPEETPKNIMIKAIRAQMSEEKKQKALDEYNAAVRMLGVQPYLNKLLSDSKE